MNIENTVRNPGHFITFVTMLIQKHPTRGIHKAMGHAYVSSELGPEWAVYI